MSKQWTAEDENAIDEEVSSALWNENTHSSWAREVAIRERCEEAENERAKTPNWKHR